MSDVRIGVVEDNDIDFYALQRGLGPAKMLRRWTDGEDLIRSLLNETGILETLDVLLLDLGLPGISGVHVAQTIRRTPGGANVKVVVLTGAMPPPAVQRELEPLVDEIRTKPANRRQLSALDLKLDELAAA